MSKIKKSPTALRTISEVANDLELPQHVLRFWETKFQQLRPMKRNGSRRYYRPDDLKLLKKIKGLLYEDRYTIKGVQSLLKSKEDSKIKKNNEKLLPNSKEVKITGIKRIELKEIIEELSAIKNSLNNLI